MWTDLVCLRRFSGAQGHYFIPDFLQSVAKRYQENGRARDFVLDLLRVKVNKLLAVEPGEYEAAGAEVQRNFRGFLQDFIRRNALKLALLREMKYIMVCIQWWSASEQCFIYSCTAKLILCAYIKVTVIKCGLVIPHFYTIPYTVCNI